MMHPTQNRCFLAILRVPQGGCRSSDSDAVPSPKQPIADPSDSAVAPQSM